MREVIWLMANRPDERIVREIGTETVVYDARTHRAHCLGRTAATVWREWDGRSGQEELADRVGRALSEPIDEASVRLAVRHLRRAGLIEGSLPPGWSGSGRERRKSRRRALRSVGAMAGLAVMTLAVPSPAQVAATCTPNGRACSRSSECCSGCCNVNSGRCSGGGRCAVP
jgi:hypothetical protein